MDRGGGKERRQIARFGLLAAGLLTASLSPAGAADFREERFRESTLRDAEIEIPPPLPRFFPHADGDRDVAGPVPIRRRVAGCVPRRVPVPTNAPDDPSYVGSSYGLGKPSVYGFTPPLGVDDPFGRPLLRYCP